MPILFKILSENNTPTFVLTTSYEEALQIWRRAALTSEDDPASPENMPASMEILGCGSEILVDRKLKYGR